MRFSDIISNTEYVTAHETHKPFCQDVSDDALYEFELASLAIRQIEFLTNPKYMARYSRKFGKREKEIFLHLFEAVDSYKGLQYPCAGLEHLTVSLNLR